MGGGRETNGEIFKLAIDHAFKNVNQGQKVVGPSIAAELAENTEATSKQATMSAPSQHLT